MWSDTRFQAFCKKLCKEYDAYDSDIQTMIDEELDSECEFQKKRNGTRLTAKAIAGIQETVLDRCEHWATDKEFHIDLRKLTSYDIASYRRSALYFRSLKRKGKSNAKKQKTD